jgi:predicted TIM-barrel fold metal-dependent hydrolase
VRQRRKDIQVKSRICDANVFVGNHPFKQLASATLDDTARMFSKLGIERAIVSPIEAVFHEDAHISESMLAKLLNPPRLVQFKVVNPAEPGWPEELRRSMQEWPVAGIRLASLYHGYTFGSGTAGGVFDFARENNLPVQVFARMQDIRMQHGIIAAEPKLDDVSHAVRLAGEDVRLLVSGLSLPGISTFVESASPNVFFDTSRLQAGWKALKRIEPRCIKDHLVFGSLWPINSPECPITELAHAGLAPDVLEAVMRGNFERYVGPL